MKKNSTMQEAGNSVSSNPFIALCLVEDQTPLVLEEGEMLPSKVIIIDSAKNNGDIEIPVPNPCVVPILQENLNSPANPSSSPSYAEILKKKMVNFSGSFDEDTFEQSSKKGGRKSRKEIREEEAECLKMQGSQATIEMSMGRGKRNRSQKGGSTPSGIGK